jgi:NADH:ubiquinone oxidoreductase subunit 2 (subunit N)
MNWTLALPEIVLAVVGMATLVFGVLRKQPDPTLMCTMFTIGGFLLAGLLVLTRTTGFGFNGQIAADPFSAFNQVLILSGAALSLILALDWNRVQGIARFEYPVLMLFCTIGMMIMAAAANLMTLYLGLELQWHLAGVRLLRDDGPRGAAFLATATGQCVGRAGRGHRVRAGRAGLQGLRRAVPHVDAGRL